MQEGVPVSPVGAQQPLEALQFLTASSCTPPVEHYFDQVVDETESLDDVGFDQLNRLLLAAGENRISRGFYDYFTDLGGSFSERLGNWRAQAMRRYGNFRFPYKSLSTQPRDAIEQELAQDLVELREREIFGDGLRPIPMRDTPLLGYIAGAGAEAIEQIPEAERGEAERNYLARRAEAIERGLHNTYEYLCATEMDVYVATSMRRTEEFYSISRLLGAVFQPGDGVEDPTPFTRMGHFDPTQSFHADRIVKGLVEGLMLKRSRCTIYMAQERDTLGKDSELATTLAQGKPVIAFIPQVEDRDEFSAAVSNDLRSAADDDPLAEGPNPHWNRLSETFFELFPREFVEKEYAEEIASEPAYERALTDYVELLTNLYDKRARVLRDQHPLGLQVDLDTGVANGILIARSAEQCREIVLDVLERGMQFELEAKEAPNLEARPDLESPRDWDRYLVEKRTKCVHRVVVGDKLVSNAFWNWYLESPDLPALTQH